MPKLSRDQLAHVELELVKGAEANGYPNDVWTLQRVAERPEQHQYEGGSIAEVAEMMAKHVVDPRTVKSPATRRQPKQFPVGIDYVLVNGKVSG